MSTNGVGRSNNSVSEFSEQILLSCLNARQDSCYGGYIQDASGFIQSYGLPLYSCFPYTETNWNGGPDTPCADVACSFWQSQTYSIKGWEWVTPQTSPTAADLENALTTYGPLVTTMNVFSDFYHYAGGVYSVTNGATYEGGHAIEIIGFNHASEYFIVKNSWGTGWGTTVPGSVTTPGFFLIAYSQIAEMSNFRYGGPEFGWYSIAYTGYSQDPCSYSLSSGSASPNYSGGKASVGVTSLAGCSWTAVSNVGWISIVSGATGKGDGSVTYFVSANNATASRVGTLTIAGITFTVTQAAATCSDSFISPQSASPTYSGGNATVTVTWPSGCSWTAASNVSWITVLSGASGTGRGTVMYSVSENTATTSRIGTLTIAGQTFTVTQGGRK